MSRILLIGVDCISCSVILTNLYKTAAPVVIIEDSREPGAKDPVQAMTIHRLTMDQMAVKEQPNYYLPSKREERQQRQPFYRGLKKYQKY